MSENYMEYVNRINSSLRLFKRCLSRENYMVAKQASDNAHNLLLELKGERKIIENKNKKYEIKLLETKLNELDKKIGSPSPSMLPAEHSGINMNYSSRERKNGIIQFILNKIGVNL
ncbi:MAG: hypothetical protein KKF48_04645 [Nanoarchaeota archaeon]|nr:hypothetical protein [Nanoarchaeota archaeon]MBU1028305.1 hypothetical protein [Nanoarchaeota archaeon]